MKNPLLEGETWQVIAVDDPLLGYGPTTFTAIRLNEGVTAIIKFYASIDVSLGNGDRFVVFSSDIDEVGWAKTHVITTTFPLASFSVEVFSSTDWANLT